MNAEHLTEKSDIDIKIVQEQLRQYGEANGLRDLEGRIMRGLDPAALLAVPQTRQRIESLANEYGADMDSVEKLVKDLHVGGVWTHAAELKAGSPETTVWIVIGEATVRDKATLGDLTSEQFADDTKRVINALDTALQDPHNFAQMAHINLIERSKEQFTIEDDVPISDTPEGFLAMAVNGLKGGIVQDAANQLFFVGANKLDFDSVAIKHGLALSTQEDRGRMATFYVDSEQVRHIKQLYPGLGIILDGDITLAKELAQTATAIDSEDSPSI